MENKLSDDRLRLGHSSGRRQEAKVTNEFF
jgi:hypothetical protein